MDFATECTEHYTYLVNLPMLRSMCHSMHEEPEDIVHEVIIKAIRFEDKFQPGTNLSGWLRRIALNTAKNKLRSHKIRTSHNNLLTIAEVVLHTGELTTPHSVEMPSLRDAIQEAIANLPEAFRETVALYHLKDMVYRDIAVHLSIPLGTVMSRLFRGRILLQEALRPLAEELLHGHEDDDAEQPDEGAPGPEAS